MSTAKPTIILLLSIFLVMCSEKSEISKLSSDEEKRIQALGKNVTGLLLKTLQKELKKTIEKKGMSAALTVCNSSALYLTDSLSKSMDEIIEIKRTSLRFRNPKNAPDAHERKILAQFQSSLQENGQPTEEIIERFNDGSTEHYRYYKPLMVKSLCLNCHGQADMISPEMYYHINRLYPYDHATGYKNEQFRGVVRVSIR